MKRKKVIILVATIIVFISVFIWLGYNFAPSSYPYAEEYEIDAKETEVIRAVENFKMGNPEYIIPIQVGLIDGRKNENGKQHWYHIYLFYKDENKIIYCWTRPSGKDKTTLAFVSINDGLVLGNWKDINKDFSYFENREEKNKFETLILNRIKEEL